MKHIHEPHYVEATPMNYGEKKEKGIGCTVYFHNESIEYSDDEPGYHIVSDNEEEWLPKDVFENEYKPFETHVDRMKVESDELAKKTDKLAKFIFNNDVFKTLPKEVQALLVTQFHLMSDYYGILSMRISESTPYGMNFEQALPLLREGFVIRRSGWNNKGMMVFKQVPAHINSEIIPKMQSLPEEAKRHILDAGDHIDYCSQCLIFNPKNGEANSWVPSISDVFANDWELVL